MHHALSKKRLEHYYVQRELEKALPNKHRILKSKRKNPIYILINCGGRPKVKPWPGDKFLEFQGRSR
jgi:hypothetical protein